MQDEKFVNSEADNWFLRNKEGLGKSFDIRNELIKLLPKENIKSIIDLGCSNGWRLASLSQFFNEAKELVGIEPSEKAIEDGKIKFPSIKFYAGTLAEIPIKEKFDLIIVSHVLHWIDRNSLLKSVSEIDRVVNDGGYLILADFYPDFPQKKHYHHLPEDNLYTYKQDYSSIFTATNLYKEIGKITFNHDNKPDKLGIFPARSDERVFCSILQKKISDYYLEI